MSTNNLIDKVDGVVAFLEDALKAFSHANDCAAEELRHAKGENRAVVALIFYNYFPALLATYEVIARDLNAQINELNEVVNEYTKTQ